jgi:hypothetical protein
MFDIREDGDFSPDDVAFGCLGIFVSSASWQGGQWLDLKWFGLRKYERPVLRDRERRTLTDSNHRISDPDFGRCIPPQKRNAPGGEENSGAETYGTNSDGSGPLDQPRAQIRSLQSLFHFSSPSC